MAKNLCKKRKFKDFIVNSLFIPLLEGHFPTCQEKILVSNEELNMAACSLLHKIPAASFTNFTENLSYPAYYEYTSFLFLFQ